MYVVNQTVSPAFCRWLESFAREHRTVVLLSGNAPADSGPELIVYRGPAYDRSSVRSRLWTWAQFTAWATWKLLLSDRRIPVFAVTNPPLMPLAAWLLHAVQGRRYGLLEWDIYPQVLEAMGLMGSGHVLVRWWRSLHGRALRASDLVITIGERMAAVLRKMAEIPELDIAVVPNWVDTNRVQPLDREDNEFVRAQGLHEGLVVLYSGNLGATHAIETIVQVAKEFNKTEGVLFLVVGEGTKRAIVEEAVEAGRVPNLRLLPKQPPSIFPQVLASAQIGIVTLADGLEGLSMPSKTYDLMAAGTAILGISRPLSDLSATIEHHVCGACFSPRAVTDIVTWIRSIACSPGELERMRRASRRAAVEYYSTAAVPLTLTDLIRERLLS